MLAVGLAIAACQAGYSVYFTTLDDLVRNLKEAEASGRFARKLQTYLKPAVLVVDEVGCAPRGAWEPCGRRSPPLVIAVTGRS
jgi:DNA replication protein DnaC